MTTFQNNSAFTKTAAQIKAEEDLLQSLKVGLQRVESKQAALNEDDLRRIVEEVMDDRKA